MRRRAGTLADALEFYLRRFLRTSLCGEVRFVLKARSEESGDHNGWKSVTLGVEGLCGFVEAHSLNGDAVLRALKLRLKIPKILCRFQIRVLFDHYHHVR